MVEGEGGLCSDADLLVGHLIGQVLQQRRVAGNVQVACMALWFFNPFTFAVATRGNCEALVCVVIIWVLMCLMAGSYCFLEQLHLISSCSVVLHACTFSQSVKYEIWHWICFFAILISGSRLDCSYKGRLVIFRELQVSWFRQPFGMEWLCIFVSIL
jgi:hypothetical protein